MATPGDARPAPGLRVVAASGVAVVLVVVFVAAIAFGSRPAPSDPGDRLGLTRRGHGQGLAVVAVRCPSERVVGVEVRQPEGDVAWRILSRKGSIEDRYPVGGEPPLGFDVDVPLDRPLPAGPMVLTLRLSRQGPGGVTDQVVFDSDEVPEEGILHRGVVVRDEGFERRALSGVECPGATDDLDAVTVAFAAAAAAVLVAYATLVQRWWRGRRPGRR